MVKRRAAGLLDKVPTKRLAFGFLTITLLLGVFALIHASFIGNLGDFFREDVRHISVCVLNDEKYPVSEDVIRKILEVVFKEFREKTGIVFHAEGIAPFRKKLTGTIWSWGVLFKETCPMTEMGIFFTNLRVIQTAKVKKEFSDFVYVGIGYVVLYNAEGFFSKNDAGGGPEALTVLRHGIAHLFGVDHLSDKGSFMYEYTNESHGHWTDEVVKIIKKNRDVKIGGDLR